jgi:hypothetical protein
MDKIIVVGGFEFLGFYLSTAFLEKGIPVQCILLENSEDPFLEEKRFAVGRNVNFSEIAIADWPDSSFLNNGETLLIVSLYDLLLKKRSDHMIEQIEHAFGKVIALGESNGLSIVLALPMRLKLSEEKADEPLYHCYFNIMKKIRTRKIPFKQIYLPTLYGPWQPFEYLFQQVLACEAKERREYRLCDREWVEDAIYIEDAVTEMISIIENEQFQVCALKSSEKDHWKKCAALLRIEPDVYAGMKTERTVLSEIPFVEVKQRVRCEEGLILQKQHLLRLLSGV